MKQEVKQEVQPVKQELDKVEVGLPPNLVACAESLLGVALLCMSPTAATLLSGAVPMGQLLQPHGLPDCR